MWLELIVNRNTFKSDKLYLESSTGRVHNGEVHALAGKPCLVAFRGLSVHPCRFCATTRRRCGHHTGRNSGRFCSSQCANPTHGMLKSSNQAELRFVAPSGLHAVRGKTSQGSKICIDCIIKLSRKKEFRNLFEVRSTVQIPAYTCIFTASLDYGMF